MDVAGLRKLLESARVYAVGPHYAPEAREDGWQWSVALVTTEPNSIAGMQIMLTRGFAALLAVAEAAEELRERDVFYESYADCTDADLTLDAIELRDMWLRFTAALAALAAPADAGTEEGG